MLFFRHISRNLLRRTFLCRALLGLGLFWLLAAPAFAAPHAPSAPSFQPGGKGKKGDPPPRPKPKPGPRDGGDDD